MKLDIVKTVKNIWKPGISTSKETELTPSEIEAQMKLLQIFPVGDFYWYVFNVHDLSFDYVSPEVKELLNYNLEEFSVPLLFASFHADDYPYFFNFENSIIEFLETLSPEQKLKYKFRYDYRLKKKDGTYLRIMQQSLALQLDENNKVSKVLGVHTDISHLKKNGIPMLSFIGLDGEPTMIDVKVKELFKPVKNSLLTKREMDIVELLFEGKSSEEIGLKLFISKQTVDKHRSNILNKTNCKNTAELIGKVIKTDWFNANH